MKMDRRTFLVSAGLAAAVGGSAFLWQQRNNARDRIRANLKRPSGKQSNILFIVTDQERSRPQLPDIPLPQRDRLMERSTIFSNATAVTNLCSTARGTIFSGLHPQQNGLWDNTPLPYASDLRRDVPTLGTMMQDAGYVTGYFGKWHLTNLPHEGGIGRQKFAALMQDYGFDHTDQEGERDGTHVGFEWDPVTARSAATFMERQKSDEKPWFAAVNLVNPHDIMFFMTSEHQRQSRVLRFPDKIAGAPIDPLYHKDWQLDLPQNFGPATLAGKPEAQQEMQRVMELTLGEIPFEDEDGWRLYQNYYANCLRDVDRWIGFLLDALEATGQADNTIVVFTSDHGEMAGVHGLREKGANLYRENSNVPLWIRHPDIKDASETLALASHIDIAPTMLALAGIPIETTREAYPMLKGVDLSTALSGVSGRGVDSAGRTAALCQWTSLIHLSSQSVYAAAAVLESGGLIDKIGYLFDDRRKNAGATRGAMRGLYDGRHKFARYFSPRDHHTPASYEDLVARNDLELYDTAEDPGETINLAQPGNRDASRERIETLNATLTDLIRSEVGEDTGSFLPGALSPWAV